MQIYNQEAIVNVRVGFFLKAIGIFDFHLRRNRQSVMDMSELPPPIDMAQNQSVLEPKTSGLAIASLVCGVLGFATCISSLPAVIMGHLAIRQIKNSSGKETGRGLAIGGLVTGYIVLAIFPIAILAGLATPAVINAKKMAEMTKETHEMKMMAPDFFDYHTAHGKWPTSLEDLVDEGMVSSVELDELISAKADEGSEWVYFPEAQYGVTPAEILLMGPEFGGKRPLLMTDGALRQKSSLDADREVTAQGGKSQPIPVKAPRR